MISEKKKETDFLAVWDWSYLTSLLLPEDSRLRVSFGFTREGGSAALSHNLVPWADDKLGRSWSQRGKASVLVRKWYEKRLNIRTGDYRGGGGVSSKKQAIYNTVKSKWECRTELPCSFISVVLFLKALNKGRTPITIIAMATRLAIHPGEAEAEWMTVTLAFTQGSALVTMALLSETTQRHTHALETSKTMRRYRRIRVNSCLTFSYVRFSMHQNASHVKVMLWSGSVHLIKESERQKRLFLCLQHFKLTPLHQREKRLEKLSNFEIAVWSFLSQYSQLHQEPDQLSCTRSRHRVRHFWLTTRQMQFNTKREEFRLDSSFFLPSRVAALHSLTISLMVG